MGVLQMLGIKKKTRDTGTQLDAKTVAIADSYERDHSSCPSREYVAELLSEPSIKARRDATLKAASAPRRKPMRGLVSLSVMREGTARQINSAHGQALLRQLRRLHAGKELTHREVLRHYREMCEGLDVPERPFEMVLHELAELIKPKGATGRAARPQRTIHRANATRDGWESRTERVYWIPKRRH